MKGAALFATVLDSKGVAIDTPWIKNSSCAAGPCNPGGNDASPVPPEVEPAGTRVVWLTPGDYKFLAADAFYSLFPCLALNHFKELELTVRRMHYRHGDLDGIRFAPEETPMEDLIA
jgi:hypothetical protein